MYIPPNPKVYPGVYGGYISPNPKVYPGVYGVVYLQTLRYTRVCRWCIPVYMPPYHATRVYIPVYTTLRTPWVHLAHVRHRAGYAADNGRCAEKKPWAQGRGFPWVRGSREPPRVIPVRVGIPLRVGCSALPWLIWATIG